MPVSMPAARRHLFFAQICARPRGLFAKVWGFTEMRLGMTIVKAMREYGSGSAMSGAFGHGIQVARMRDMGNELTREIVLQKQICNN